MLTKNHLKFRRIKGGLRPTLLNPEDSSLVDYCHSLQMVYQRCVGEKFCELKEQVKSLPKHVLGAAFEKLLDDRLEFAEIDASKLGQRWESLQQAEKIRQQSSLSLMEFQQQLGQVLDRSFAGIEEELYGDLPQFRTIRGFRGLPAEGQGLIHRYNCAQIQGLLLRSRFLTIEIELPDLSERRKFFRLLRFHRLLAKLEKQSGSKFTFTLSGPMGIFSASQAYGLRLANFFPHVLHARSWQISGDICWDGKEFSLNLPPCTQVKSHYQKTLSGHIPKEFQSVINAVQEKSSWVGGLGEEALNLGQDSFCFPDFTFQHPKKGTFHVELFHRWYRRNLASRITELRGQKTQLVVGACSSLKKEVQNKTEIPVNDSQIRFFWFRDFPSAKAILAQLP